MSVEQQYIDLFSQTEAMICRHSAEVLNAPRAAAFADFERLGFPTRKVEKYKYTDSFCDSRACAQTHPTCRALRN